MVCDATGLLFELQVMDASHTAWCIEELCITFYVYACVCMFFH